MTTMYYCGEHWNNKETTGHQKPARRKEITSVSKRQDDPANT